MPPAWGFSATCVPRRAGLDLPLDVRLDLPGEPLAEVHRLLLLHAERQEALREAVDQELGDVLGLLHVLEAHLAEIELRDPFRHRRDEGGRRRGEQHLPAVARRTDPRRAMDVDPDVPLLPDDRLPGVEAHRTRSAPSATRGERALSATTAADIARSKQ